MTDLATDWLTDLATDRVTDRATDWVTDWVTDRVIDWVTDWMTDLSNSLMFSNVEEAILLVAESLGWPFSAQTFDEWLSISTDSSWKVKSVYASENQAVCFDGIISCKWRAKTRKQETWDENQRINWSAQLHARICGAITCFQDSCLGGVYHRYREGVCSTSCQLHVSKKRTKDG